MHGAKNTKLPSQGTDRGLSPVGSETEESVAKHSPDFSGEAEILIGNTDNTSYEQRRPYVIYSVLE